MSCAVPAEWDTYEKFDLRSANQKPWRKITIACKIETTANERKNVYYQLYLAARKELTGQLLFSTFGLLSVILIFTLHIAVSRKRICVGRSGIELILLTVIVHVSRGKMGQTESRRCRICATKLNPKKKQDMEQSLCSKWVFIIIFGKNPSSLNAANFTFCWKICVLTFRILSGSRVKLQSSKRTAFLYEENVSIDFVC